jgi:5-(carboxyamino)imidazole ribonucleotide synthase
MMDSSTPLQPGAAIGILGGGQLGRMLALAGARLGFDVHVFDPEPNCPAARVCDRAWSAPWSDLGAVEGFAGKCAAVTFEFENVPLAALKAAAGAAPVRPGARSLELTQDRVTEKDFINGLGIPTAPWAAVDSLEGLKTALEAVGAPAILKTRRFGYDGKGQARLKTADDAARAWDEIGGQPAILEGFAPFTRELSVVAARGLDGRVVAFPLAENIHKGGILRESRAPAEASASLCDRATAIADKIGAGLGHVGVFAVELFDMGADGLWVNEIAPRVHNSGHWTMDACPSDQFEQHMRAVAGWPLGDPAPHSRCTMTNLIGHDVDAWGDLIADPDVRLHLYGKREVRDGRKMGHVNRLTRL